MAGTCNSRFLAPPKAPFTTLSLPIASSVITSVVAMPDAARAHMALHAVRKVQPQHHPPPRRLACNDSYHFSAGGHRTDQHSRVSRVLVPVSQRVEHFLRPLRTGIARIGTRPRMRDGIL